MRFRMLLRVADFLIFPLQYFPLLFLLFFCCFATFVCHWAAHIAVAVVINGPTKAEDVSRDDAAADDDDTRVWPLWLLAGLPFKWNLCSQAR